MWLNVCVFVYAIFQMVFGIWGTIQANEIKSAIGGVAIGVLQLICLAITKKNPRVGRIGSLVVALLVVGQFSRKFFVEGIWYPAGIEVLTSLALAILLVAGHFLAQRKKTGGA